jgi:Wiskott-Aldrich syndrome protein
VDGDRDALLASIRGAGLGSLKKVDKSQLDRPSVLLQEQRGEAPPPSAGGVPGGSLADALAAALNQRKAKVSHSDNESDGEEW